MNYALVLRSSLLGKDATIIYRSKEYQGRIVKETRNTLVIQLQKSNRKVTIPKSAEALIRLPVAPRKIVEIQGNTLIGRSTDRLKRRRWKSW
jgi:RNase P/RNase MRP subunit p29